jgi:toxin-antitoxin system PIN domain toxin
MLMPDVNILICAHRRDAPSHAAYHAWWNDLVNGPSPFALSTGVASAFVRILTQPRMPGGPTPLPVVLAFIDDVVARPTCRLVTPDQRQWSITSRLCRATGATGKLVADADHAAVAIASGSTWISRDRDFDRFAAHGLDWRLLAL